MLIKITTFVHSLLFIALIVCGLIFSGMIFGLYEMRVVRTGSMSPTIPTGSAIFIRPSETFAVDDVVTFRRVDDAAVTTHRIVGTEAYEDQTLYTTRGDANDAADQRPVREDEILGRVIAHVPYLGFMIEFFRTPLGFLFIVVIPASLILLEQMRKIRNEIRKKEAKSEPETI